MKQGNKTFETPIPYQREASTFSIAGTAVTFNGKTVMGSILDAVETSRLNPFEVVRGLGMDAYGAECWCYFYKGEEYDCEQLFDMSLPPVEHTSI